MPSGQPWPGDPNDLNTTRHTDIRLIFKMDKNGYKACISPRMIRFQLQTVWARGQTLLDGALNGKVETEDCTWCLVNGGTELNVMLTKQNDPGLDVGGVVLVTFWW